MNALRTVMVIVMWMAACGCGGSGGTSPNIDSPTIRFGNPRAVAIVGYSGHAMEPFISRDGQILFFNNLNEPEIGNTPNDTNLHYATRINDATFRYEGEVAGADTDATIGTLADDNELEAVASMDATGKLYFIRTIDYKNAGPDHLRSLFRGDYAAGALTNLESLPNLRSDRPANAAVEGELNFDAEISPDGNRLYFVEGLFSGKTMPDEADIGVAVKSGSSFVVDADSTSLFAMVNTNALEYAPSVSANGLELYFTRFVPPSDVGIYLSTRETIGDAWRPAVRIDAIAGDTTEAPSISFDGRLLYYHQKAGGIYQVFVVTRE